MVASDEPERLLGLRVGGDVLDDALLASRLGISNLERGRALPAAAAVAPVVVLGWLRTRDEPRSDDRSGRDT